MDGPDLTPEVAEQLILEWDPSACPDRTLFGANSDRAAADLFLRAVDYISSAAAAAAAAAASPRRLSSSSSPLQIAMARLEDEFRHVLTSRALDVDPDLGSLSLSSVDLSDDESVVDDSPHDSSESSSRGGSAIRRSGRSMKSIREIDLLPSDAVHDLRLIASRMIDSGHSREVFQVYATVRRAAVDRALRRLGVERLSIGDVHRLGWPDLESKIRRWIRAAQSAVRVLFASELRLADSIFDSSSSDPPFLDSVKGSAIQLLSFAEAISIGRRSPEKLFKILDLHDSISDLLPDVAAVFRSKSPESIYTQAAEILSRLADSVRGILSEFETAVLREPSRIPVPGGTIHPLTRYVMNYISLISDYKQTLIELIVSKPNSAISRFSDDPAVIVPEIEVPEPENELPLAAHLVWIIAILQFNLENKANLYKDSAISHLFLMNNVHYIVQKVKHSPELRELIGDDYLRRMTGKVRQSATSYQRATWVRILCCLRDEGIHVSGSFSSGVSKSTLRERFKSFNVAFDEVHRTQAIWFVPDSQLREELRISITERLLPAYRSFLGRFRHHIESGRHPEMYIKYSVEDLETALSDFFEGCPPSVLSRRKSH